jgi:hypothetical protein
MSDDPRPPEGGGWREEVHTLDARCSGMLDELHDLIEREEDARFQAMESVGTAAMSTAFEAWRHATQAVLDAAQRFQRECG